MTNDELFEPRELMQFVLSEKLKAKRARIERRLQVLDQRPSDACWMYPLLFVTVLCGTRQFVQHL